MKKYIGFIFGFLLGLLGILMATTGLAARTGEILGSFFTPVFFLFKNLGPTYFGALFPIGIFLNGLLFGLIGYLIQKWLRSKNKSEYAVIYIFATIIVLFILALIVECTVVRTCMA